MAVDLKYGKVTLEHGSIGENEPVVVFSAQDNQLLYLLMAYYTLCSDAGSPQHHLDNIQDNIKCVEAWQHKNGARVPNSNEYFKRIGGSV